MSEGKPKRNEQPKSHPKKGSLNEGKNNKANGKGLNEEFRGHTKPGGGKPKK